MPSLYTSCLGRRQMPDGKDPDREHFPLVFSENDQQSLRSVSGTMESRKVKVERYQSTDSQAQRDEAQERQRRRLKRKQREKEMKKRAHHVVHSSWKWLKRGFIAIAPAMTSMLTFSPTPANLIYATSEVRRDMSRNNMTSSYI
ncbi:uncharacterized protein LOC131940419 [Physella acuta]|uniref:uncharacterized protein LOC131940419 n=1 Tax=Physella acuta TaxID=109671 RepID=UPI0027DDC1D5|nr:uncharacterized protein LOC131940419 [Physella acuta]XP_059155013.1 uncharacterized protein LOC131940419 [Physella acuta]XP_059155014.1 uncharacterized protein LOC131940419 [Physella acuta]XP_059155015.1 uncharacterized protein LOC131940419 [Physella acuta]